MTKILLELPKWLKCTTNVQNIPNTSKWPKCSQNLQNGHNTPLQLLNDQNTLCWKIWFCISYKTHNGSNNRGSTILIERPLNLILIPHGAQETWSLNQFTCMCLKENKRAAYTHMHTISMIYVLKILYVSLFIHNWLSNWASLLGLPNRALVCGLRWNQREQIRL